MPIFVYEPDVDTNSHDLLEGRVCCYFETLQWANEAPLSQCPECGKPIRRALTGFAHTTAQTDPLRGVAKKLGDGIDAGVSSASGSQSGGLISAAGKSPAERAARLAYRHICSKNCRH